ncbi:MAG: DsbA family protein [Paludibaculum sp.]
MDHQLINDDEVLADIAVNYGFTREDALAAVRDPQELADYHQLAISVAQQGIQGVPFFIFDNKFAVSGCQPQEVFGRAFEYALDPETLKAAQG